MTDAAPHCPRCHALDVEAVRLLVDAEKKLFGPTVGVGLSDPPPELSGLAQRSLLTVAGIAITIGLLLICLLGRPLAWAIFAVEVELLGMPDVTTTGKLYSETVAVIMALIVGGIVTSFALYRWLARRSWQRDLDERSRLHSHWLLAYRCPRDDGFFMPNNYRFVPASEVHGYMLLTAEAPDVH